MRAVFAVLVACLSVACAPEPLAKIDLPSSLDPQGLTETQSIGLYNAANDWFIASAGKFELMSAGNTALPVIVRGLTKKERYGQTTFDAERITISFDAGAIESDAKLVGTEPDKVYQNVFAHEIGHAL